MKRTYIFLLILICSSSLLAQTNSDVAKYSQVKHYELQENKILYEYDRATNSIKYDTAFIAPKGFLFNQLIKRRVDNENYIIITFPDFVGGFQNDKAIRGGEKEALMEFAGDDIGLLEPLNKKHNGKWLVIKESEYNDLPTKPIYKRFILHGSGGILTLPFKLRGAEGDIPRSITTDVTIGAYYGLRMRVSKKSEQYLTLPVNLGLTFININSNTTDPNKPQPNDNSIVPGISTATGLIYQIDKFQIGAVIGIDFGTGVAGTDWIYNEKPWFSFAKGYSFLN